MSLPATLLAVALTASSTGTPTREASYRRAALLNAAAADKCQADLEATAAELGAEQRRALTRPPPAPPAPPESSITPPILYGVAGLGIGLAVGALLAFRLVGD